MLPSRWGRWLKQACRATRRRAAPRPYTQRPLLEVLEDRLAPALTVGTNVNISVSAAYQAETTIAVDPTDGQRLFAASNLAGNGLFAGFSTDGGTSWTTRTLAGGADGLAIACCDPSASWDQFGNLFVTYLAFSPTRAVVLHSANGGQTFTQVTTFSIDDQPTITTGPGLGGAGGSVWLTWNRAGGIQAVGAPVSGFGLANVGAFGAVQSVPGSVGNYGDISVGPNGQVMVVWQDQAGGQGPTDIEFSVDADGLGAGGFSTASVITTSNVGGFDFIPAQNSRSVDAEAGLAWDRSGGPNNGRVYLTYADETPNESHDLDIFVRFSDNNGAAWSTPVRVNDDATTRSQFLQKIALDQTSGNVAVIWYDSRNDAGGNVAPDSNNVANDDAQIFGTISTDGGLTFEPNVQISTGASRAGAIANANEYGDYTGLTFNAGVFYPVWADNSVNGLTPVNPAPLAGAGPRNQPDVATAAVSVVVPGARPVVTTTGSALSYLENAGAVAIDPGLTVTDADSATLVGASVQITGNYFAGEDVLSFTNILGITGSFNAGTGLLTLTGTATVANYQTALRTVAYRNTSDSPRTVTRVVSFRANDGGNSAPATRNITITAVNDAPSFTDAGNVSVIEDAGPQTVFNWATALNTGGGTTTSTTTVNSTDVPKVIAALTTNTSVLPVALARGAITDVNARIASLTSTLSSNLVIDLLSPLGTTVNLFNGRGTGANLSNTVFDDESTTPLTLSNSPFNGVFRPEQSLGAFDGQDPSGTWQLRVTNNGFTSAQVQNWSLTITVLANAESGQTLTFVFTANDNPGLFQTLPAINPATGTLTFTPAANAFGVANLTVVLQDSGAVANGGVDTSIPHNFTITISGVNDPPVITPTVGALAYQENDGPRPVDAGLLVTDVDDVTLTGATVQITSNYFPGEDVLSFTNQLGITGSFNPLNGLLTLTGTTLLSNYQTALRTVAYTNTSESPRTLTRTVTFTATDPSSGVGSNTRNITVTAVNDPPVVSPTLAVLAYTENQTLAVDPGVGVTDVDSPILTGATVGIAPYFAGQDVFAFTNTGSITGIFNPANGVLTLSGTATVGEYQAALQSVTYTNTSDTPNTTARTVTFTVTDASASNNTGAGTRTINLTPVNDVPVVATTGTPLGYVEGQGAVAVDSGLTLSDADDTQATGATVALSPFFLAEDALAFPGAAGITGSFNTTTGVLTLSGTATLTAYQAALRSVTYANSSSNPNPTTRRATFSVTDAGAAGILPSVTGSGGRDITVTGVNNPPVVTTSPGSITYTEGEAAKIIDPSVGIIDADNTTASGATVAITGGLARDEDILVFTDTALITGIFLSATGVLTLTGTASLADYAAALSSVRYVNNSDSPSTASRTITFTVNDGSAGNNLGSATRSITIISVNDAPVFTSQGNVTVNEDSGASTVVNWATDIRPNQGTVRTFTATDVPVALPDQATTVSSLAVNVAATRVTDVNVNLTLLEHPFVGDLVLNLISPSNAQINLISRRGADGDNFVDLVLDDEAPTPIGQGAAPFTGSFRPEQALAAFDNINPNGVWRLEVRDVAGVDSGLLRGWSLTLVLDGGPEVQTITVSTSTSNPSLFTAGGQPSFTINPTNPLSANLTFTPAANQNGFADVTVTFADDGSTANGGVDRTSRVFRINVTAVNDAPALALTAGALAYRENDNPTPVDGLLTVTDVENDTLVGATVQLTGNYVLDEDVLAFPGLGTSPQITATFDRVTGTLQLSGVGTTAEYTAALRLVTYVNTSENPSSLDRTVTITVDDGNAASNLGSATRTITVTPVNDVPLFGIQATAMTFTENQGATPVDPGLTLVDVDHTQLVGATIALTPYVPGQDVLAVGTAALLTGSFNTTTGVLTLTGVATVAEYEAVLRTLTYANTSENPQAGNRTVTFTANDGVGVGTGSRTVTVVAVNDPTVVTTSSTQLAYDEDQGPVAIDPALTLAEVDNTTLQGATVQITGGYANGQDVLGFINQAGITGLFDAGTGRLTLTGVASLAAYQAALRTVTYTNTSNNPSTALRTVTFTADDGSTPGTLGSGTRILALTALNDAPVVTMTAGPLAYTENAPPVVVDPFLDIADPDSSAMSGAVIVFSAGYQAGEDNLAFTALAGITGTFNASTGALTLNGATTVANYLTVLRSISYFNSSENPSPGQRTLTVTVFDVGTPSGSSSGTASRFLNVTPVNDAPALTVATSSLLYTENQAPTLIDPGLTVADPDNVLLTGATVTLSPYFAGQDQLLFANTTQITGSFNVATGVLTLTGQASRSAYQTALRSVAFANTSNNPSTSPRGATFQVNDGTALSTPVTRVITVTAVNDLPVLTTTGTPLVYTENDPATVVDPNVTVIDADNVNLTAAFAQITVNYVPGEDLLLFTNTPEISGSFDERSGTLTLQGIASVAAYQAALRTVRYVNVRPGTLTTNDAPSPAPRTISFSAADSGVLASAVARRTLNVVAVNDAPTVTTTGIAPRFTENQGSVRLDPPIGTPPASLLRLADVDGTGLTGATVQVVNYTPGEDLLGFVDTSLITATFDVPTGTLTLRGNALLSDYQAALSSIAYLNLSEDPSPAPRTLRLTVNDGNATNGTGVGTITLTVVAVNDSPVLTVPASPVAYTENQTIPLLPTLTLTDIDNRGLVSATVQISGGYVKGEDVLGFVNTPQITGAFNTDTGLLTLQGPGTVAEYQFALQSITYTNTSNNPNTGVRQVTIVVNDGSAAMNTATASTSIAITSQNDAPVLTPSAGPLVYVENQAPAPVDSSLTLADADSTTLVAATVQITGGYVANEDILGFTPVDAFITGLYNSTTGTLTLSGSAPLANYQAALRAVTYTNRSDTPSTQPRTVTFTANDGAPSANIGTATRVLTVSAANDAPALTASPGSLSYIESQLPTPIDPGISIADSDSTQITEAAVQIVVNYARGQDVLGFLNTPEISGSFDPVTGTLRLRGTASIAAYEAALRSVTFANTSLNPSTAPRLVQFTVNDLSAESNPVRKVIGVAAINPVVGITGTPSSSPEGREIVLVAAVSGPGTFGGVTHSWRVTRAGTLVATSNTSTLRFTPADNGVYAVALVVTDRDGGTGTAQTSITVTNVAPTVGGLSITSPLPQNGTATLSGLLTDAGAADGLTLVVDWGDGTVETLTNLSAGGFAPTHSYTRVGNFIITVTATDDEGTVTTVAATTSVGNLRERFVAQVYDDVLRRPADEAAIAFWATYLSQGNTRPDMLRILTGTAEYRGLVVNDLYQRFLRRPASSDDLTFAQSLFSLGATVEQIQALLLGSPEFYQRRANSTDDGFLDVLYREVLNRSIDVASRTILRQALGTNQLNRVQVASIILSSTEYRQQLVNGYYLRYFERPADQGGLNFFVSLLQTARQEEAVSRLVGSEGYFSFDRPFIAQVYFDLLGRPADAESIGFWADYLARGNTRIQFVQLILGSLEYRTRLATNLMVSHLHRQPDPVGLPFYVNLLGAGQSPEFVRTLLVGSPEYYQNRGNGTNEGFLEALYEDAFGRPLDLEGRNSIGQALASGLATQQVAGIIFSSPEYRTRLVQGLYSQLLRRDVDTQGLLFQLAALQQGARSTDILAALVASDEYFRRL